MGIEKGPIWSQGFFSLKNNVLPSNAQLVSWLYSTVREIVIKSILSGLPALQKGAQEQVVLNKYLFEAFYTYVDFLYLFGYSWPPKYKSVHWLVFEWQWFHNPYGKNYLITETDIHHLFLPVQRIQLCLFVENIKPCAMHHVLLCFRWILFTTATRCSVTIFSSTKSCAPIS